MDKLKLAHDWALVFTQHNKDLSVAAKTVSAWAFDYADAMQAEADKREDKARPEVLLTKDKDGKCLHFHHEFGHKKCMDCGEALCEVDWNQAPNDATAWEYLGHGSARWHTTTKGMYRAADLFGYSGTDMLLVERPDGF